MISPIPAAWQIYFVARINVSRRQGFRKSYIIKHVQHFHDKVCWGSIWSWFSDPYTQDGSRLWTLFISKGMWLLYCSIRICVSLNTEWKVCMQQWFILGAHTLAKSRLSTFVASPFIRGHVPLIPLYHLFNTNLFHGEPTSFDDLSSFML